MIRNNPRRLPCLVVWVVGLSLWSAAACADPLSADLQSVEPPLVERAPTGAMARLHNLTHRASELVTQAIGLIGIRYVRGGSDPDRGLDCSGLVQLVFKQAWDRDLPRTSKEISQVGERVDAADLQPGDLVFYNTLRRGFSHVGIYLGDSKFIHAPSSGGKVRIESMNLAYWKKRFNGARRIAGPQEQ